LYKKISAIDLNDYPIFVIDDNEVWKIFISEVEVSWTEHIQAPVIWLKDGQPAQNRPRIRIHGSKSEKLEVLSVFKEDAGIYQCFVNQGSDQLQASGELRLGGKICLWHGLSLHDLQFVQPYRISFHFVHN
jgi:hypothetical protein